MPDALRRRLPALAVLLLGTALALARFVPAPPALLRLTLELAPAPPGHADPLVTTGESGRGDFLYLERLDAGQVRFGYDSWGHPGIKSAPFSLRAGEPIALAIEHPGLAARDGFRVPPGNLRVTANDRVVFAAEVHFYQAHPSTFTFGINPIGGTSTAPALLGRLTGPDGREWRGLAPPPRGLATRAGTWLQQRPGEAITLALLSLLLARRRPPGSASVRDRLRVLGTSLREHRAFVLTAAACTVVYAAVLTGGTFALGRPESFTTFFDYQARSLLQGRLDVPAESLAGEAFLHHGKVYGYFGLTPALLRLPWAIFDLGLGTLSRWFMVLYHVAILGGAYFLWRTARIWRSSNRANPATPARPLWTVLFTLNVGLGSTAFFLASRAYVYHEAIACGLAFALWSTGCSLRQFATPDRRWWQGALACGLLAVHARPPAGFFALTLLAVVALALAWRQSATWRRRGLALAAAAGLAVASFNAVSFLKFGTWEGCPLRLNVSYTPERLTKIDGRQFHLINVPYTAHAYLLRPHVEWRHSFPFLVVPGHPGNVWGGARMDMIEPLLGIPYSMPGLLLLALAAWLAAFRRQPALRTPLALLALAALPMSLAMFAAIAVSQRYLGDFCPFLFATASFGVVAWSSDPASTQRWRGLLLGALTAVAIGVTLALTLHYQGEEVWGVDPLIRERYEALQRRVDSLLTPR